MSGTQPSFEVSTHVTVDDFESGVYTVAAPNPYLDRHHPGMVHVWKREHDQTYEAWVHPSRVHPIGART
jgi:hypothetical protein